MCELLGVSAKRKINMNGLFRTFFGHSEEHKNGWGLALFDGDDYSIDKEPVKALDSDLLKSILNKSVDTSRCIAHIRKATIGDMNNDNTHPFLRKDSSGRSWVFAHNGTIFESEYLIPYQYVQVGSTDSERILLYLLDELNGRISEKGAPLEKEERIEVVESVIKRIILGNKLNIMLYDGELLYVHKNEEGTLYEKDSENGVILATVPLEKDGWREFPQNRLVVYNNGEIVYTGEKHNCTYVYDEEEMKLLFLAYSGL